MSEGAEFPTRLLKIGGGAGLAAATVDPRKVNQHIEGLPDGKRVMTDAEVERLLRDPFATLILRRGIFPKHLGEILAAFDAHNGKSKGLPLTSSFLISEGGQIRFKAGVGKGSTRLITVRSTASGSPEVMISTLLPPGVSPRSDKVLNEVQAWDPVNRTMHFYQRQAGAWFWCGQSDMALVAPTRGEGAFDSHVNGYPLMKELQSPWVHWHGPGLAISETAYAPNDPLLSDPLFDDKDHALNFEVQVVRPLMERWNIARFEKHVVQGRLTAVGSFFAQLLQPTQANLISTHTEWSNVVANQEDLDDLPPSFFSDIEGLVTTAGLSVEVPPLEMTGTRYAALVKKYDLRVRGGSIDIAGDVPFAFTVPERAEEDQLATRILVDRGVISPRLVACLLMIDFPNPVGSPRRARLLRFAPDNVRLNATKPPLDQPFVDRVKAAAPKTPKGSPEREFLANWDLGPGGWKAAFSARLTAYLAAVAKQLGTNAGCDAVFRLAESRRREFRRRPLAEFDLTLPHAVMIPATAKKLAMTEQAKVVSTN